MRGGARHASDAPAPSRSRRALFWTVWTAVGVLVLGGGLTAAAVLRLQGNIRSVDVTRQLGTDRPVAPTPDRAGDRPLNVLVAGSDTREGANGFIGGKVDGARSDTTLVLHLSADRKRAVAVSIPRDSMVQMPSCTDLTGGTKPPGLRQFNDAFTIGGIACTQRTVEQLTGLRIDHYVIVDFAGFKGMVDALGTVPICLAKPVDDVRHHIKLPAGRSRVTGTQALAYVRERYALGDGSDLGRIDRQQAFISSVLQEATSAGTLTDPPKLYGFLEAATRSVTMDPQLASIGALSSLAKQVSDVGLGNIQFVTVPIEAYPPDPNRLQWAPSARPLWKALRQDAPITFAPRGAPTRSTPATTSGADRVDPATVRVRVLDAAGSPALAARAADELRAAGWNVVGVGTATGQHPTRIRYGSGSLAASRAAALADVVPGATSSRGSGLGSTISLEVGADWPGLRAASPSPSGPATATASPSAAPVVVSGTKSRSADKDICLS
jgi:LCP family protein required for cell wall assembly